MDTAIINIKVKPEEKKQAQEAAAALGMPLSVIIKGFLKQFVRTKTIAFSAELEEKPNKYMIEELRKSEEDVKAGRVNSFKTPQEALAYLDEEIRHERKSKQSSY